MAIPEKPLALTLNVDELTLDDVALFEKDGFSAAGFKAFMARYSNWTPAEVGGLKLRELKDVAEKIGEQLRVTAVPKVNAPN